MHYLHQAVIVGSLIPPGSNRLLTVGKGFNFRLRRAHRQRMISMVADDPQSLVVHKKDELAAVIARNTGDSVEDFDGFWMLGICQVDQTNGFGGKGYGRSGHCRC